MLPELLTAGLAAATALAGYLVGGKRRRIEIQSLSVEASQTAVTSLMEALGTLRTEVEDLQREVERLQRTNRALRAENRALREAVGNLRALLMGDTTLQQEQRTGPDYGGDIGPVI